MSRANFWNGSVINTEKILQLEIFVHWFRVTAGKHFGVPNGKRSEATREITDSMDVLWKTALLFLIWYNSLTMSCGKYSDVLTWHVFGICQNVRFPAADVVKWLQTFVALLRLWFYHEVSCKLHRRVFVSKHETQFWDSKHLDLQSVGTY